MCHLEQLIYCVSVCQIVLYLFFVQIYLHEFINSPHFTYLHLEIFLKEFRISCFNIFISVFAYVKNLVYLCSFKLLGLFFMTWELTDSKAIAKY